MSSTANEISNNILNTIVTHAQYIEALDTFKQITEVTECYGREKGFLLMGPSGSGKTTLAKTMYEMFPPVEEGERTRIRAVLISMPANPTIIGVCKLILDKLGQRYSRNDTEADLTSQLKTLLKKIGALMLIIDEAQHLVDGNKIKKTPSMVADWIKQLMTDVHISVTLIGISRIETLMRANEQLSRRFSRRIYLRGFSISDVNLLNNVVSKLLATSGYQGITEYINLPSSLAMLYYATNGRLSYISLVISEAVRLAVINNNDRLTAKHFSEAFRREIWSDAKDKDNPFSGKFAPRELSRVGEPFYEDQV